MTKGRARDGMTLLVSPAVIQCGGMEGSIRLMCVKVKFSRELLVFASANGPGSERMKYNGMI